MHDTGELWPPKPDWSQVSSRRNGVTVTPVRGLAILTIAGDLSTAVAAVCPGIRLVGLGEPAEGNPYGLHIGRDRAVLVASTELPVAHGWDERGFAISPSTDAVVILELAGSGLGGLMREATTLDADRGSASAAGLFAGLPALIYRRGDTMRIHVESGHATAVWHWLDRRVG